MRKRMYVTAIFLTAVIIVSSLVMWYCSGMKNSISPQAAEYHTTYVSDKDGLAGLVDYDTTVDYIFTNHNVGQASSVVFQQYVNGEWIEDNNAPWYYKIDHYLPAPYNTFTVSGIFLYEQSARTDITYADRRIMLTFSDTVLSSDGSYHNGVLILSNIRFTAVTDHIIDEFPFIYFTPWQISFDGSCYNCAGKISYDVTVSVPGASSSDKLLLGFQGFDVSGLSDDGVGCIYTGSFADNYCIEGIQIKSGIFPGTQPHIPANYILQIEEGEMPAYYASEDILSVYPATDRCAVSYIATATGTTFRWAGAGTACTGFTLSPEGILPFSVNTNVRVESESSAVAGDKTYGAYYNAGNAHKIYPVLFSIDYSYTYTRDMLLNDQSAEDWMFDYSDTTVGGSGITSDTTYYIDINRNRYTYFFDANLPADRGALDLSGMPNDKTVVASYAESGKSDAAVSSPSLPGYWFKGWSTSPNDTGHVNQYPGAETMKSNKTFYAMWQRADYTVHFDANSLHPASQTGEYTQNSVSGTMSDQTLDYDVYQNLNANAFTREGYTFAGWNTKPDGSGTSYNDKQLVRNLTGYDNAEITLYAQWEKKLGTETITVLSEETGNPVSGVNMTLQKNVDGRWTDVVTGTTDSSGKITVNDLHWFDYRWVITSVPAGYEIPSSYETFTINYNRLSAKNEVILYMKRVSITLDSSASDIIPGENPPAFLYHISGTDVAGVVHEYNVMIQTDSTGYGTETVTGLFAGEYSVTQTAVSRYNAETPKNISNVTVKGTGATADVKNNTSAEALFPYSIKEYGWYSGTDSAVNKLVK